MKPEDRKRLKQHIEMIVEHKMPIVFCPNCEKDVECIHTAELYECKECGEDFARYIVSRQPAKSDVSMTQDVLTDIKTGQSVENTNPDYYKDELYLDEDFRALAKTYPADVSAIGVTTLIDYVEALEAELARRTKEMHYANTVCMEQRQELARRDEIITRLKEDAERLAATYVVEVFPHEWVCRGGCHHWARFGEQIDHAPDCPITLHRALMKEQE